MMTKYCTNLPFAYFLCPSFAILCLASLCLVVGVSSISIESISCDLSNFIEDNFWILSPLSFFMSGLLGFSLKNNNYSKLKKNKTFIFSILIFQTGIIYLRTFYFQGVVQYDSSNPMENHERSVLIMCQRFLFLKNKSIIPKQEFSILLCDEQLS